MPILIISFMDGLLRLFANASLAHSMPCGGRPPQHVLRQRQQERRGWPGKAGHDGRANHFQDRESQKRSLLFWSYSEDEVLQILINDPPTQALIRSPST